MRRIQRVLIVLVCICAIALSACLGPRSDDSDATVSTETTEIPDAQPDSRVENADESADLDVSSEEQAKIADIAYLSRRANPAPVRERIVLIALKYDLQEHGGFKGDSNFTRTIYEIRDRYGISTQEIAQILMDYKSWLSLNKSPI